MRIVYRATGPDTFDFIVRRGATRAAYAPDGEIRGAARVAAGSIVIQELTLTRKRGLNGLTLRAVALGEIRAQMVADLREHPDLLGARRGEYLPPSAMPRVRPVRLTEGAKLGNVLAQLATRSPQRGRRDDEFYRLVALAYVLTWWRHPRDPVATLTERLREVSELHRDVREETVAGWIRRARRDGWLTPAEHGKPGADFGAKWHATSTERRGGNG